MSAFINIRTSRKGTAGHHSPIQRMRTAPRYGKRKRRINFRLRRIIGETEPRKGKEAHFFGRQKALFNMALRRAAAREIARQALIPESCKRGDHEWDSDCNPEYCTACGMSIWAHAFMECP